MMPSQLEILLHYYYTPVMLINRHDYDHAIAFLIKEGLLIEFDVGYTTTERGKVYVEALLNIPLPKQVWSME